MTINSMQSINEASANAKANVDEELELGDEHQAEVRKRIDDLLEKKRLKDLLDDTDDW